MGVARDLKAGRAGIRTPRPAARSTPIVDLYERHLVGKDEPLSQYRVTYQPDKHHLKTVIEAHRYEMPHRSPQPPLWAWDDDEWLRVIRVPDYAPRQVRAGDGTQLLLFPTEEAP